MKEKMYTFRFDYDEIRLVQHSTDGEYGQVLNHSSTITVKGTHPIASKVMLEASLLEQYQEEGNFIRLNSLELIATEDKETFGEGGKHYV